jgi:hypothetical protein
MRPLNKVKVVWSRPLGYALGIIATDGNISPDGYHINVTSKDIEVVEHVRNCLQLKNLIGKKGNGRGRTKKYFVLQFGDVNFIKFLHAIGITPTKSKTIAELKIPNKYFPDFLRGCIDGDGSLGIFKHPETEIPQLKLCLYSASNDFIKWIQKNIHIIFKVEGGWIYQAKGVFILSFGKKDSIKILKGIYYKGVKYFLHRKYDLASPHIGRVVKWHTRTA